MKGLSVRGVNGDRGCFKKCRVVKGSRFEEHSSRQRRRSREEMCAAVAAEFSRHWRFKIFSSELLGLAVGIAESRIR